MTHESKIASVSSKVCLQFLSTYPTVATLDDVAATLCKPKKSSISQNIPRSMQ